MRFLRLPTVLCLLLIYASCSKNSDPIQLTPSFYFINGDTTSFNQNLLLFSSYDTLTYNVIISSTYLLSKDVTVTVAVDDAAISSYNSAHGTSYVAMPSSAYNFSTTVAATTTSVYDTIPVTIHKNALELNKDYLLAINIVNGGGFDINLSSSVIYLHTTSAKLSGMYNAQGTKILYTGDAADSNMNSTDSFSIVKNLIPVDSLKSLLDYADLGSNGWKYSLSFSDVGGTPSFTVGVNDVILNSIQSGSFKVLSSSYNSVTKDIYIKTSYKNTSGNERIVEESLKLQ